jgi:uncharacterized membrane protein
VAPRIRRVIAWSLVALSVVGWPLSQFWLARSEPPFVLALSWLAILLTALDVLQTTDVRVQQDGEDT